MLSTLARPILAAAVAVAALSAAAPPPAPADASVVAVAEQADILLHFKFYSNSARTTLVGEAYEYCDGTYQVIWGVETNYRRIYDYYCGY
ncbi:MAG TPA: DUF6289 family protein [Longimicrobium sp.]|nr:DUF6289 family protein [Longimicrobium sp.]